MKVLEFLDPIAASTLFYFHAWAVPTAENAQQLREQVNRYSSVIEAADTEICDQFKNDWESLESWSTLMKAAVAALQQLRMLAPDYQKWDWSKVLSQLSILEGIKIRSALYI